MTTQIKKRIKKGTSVIFRDDRPINIGLKKIIKENFGTDFYAVSKFATKIGRKADVVYKWLSMDLPIPKKYFDILLKLGNGKVTEEELLRPESKELSPSYNKTLSRLCRKVGVQRKLADMLQIHESTLSNYLHGRNMPRKHIRKRFIEMFGDEINVQEVIWKKMA